MWALRTGVLGGGGGLGCGGREGPGRGVSEEVKMGRGRGVPLCYRGWGGCWDGTRR
jgi:hypothetical protein